LEGINKRRRKFDAEIGAFSAFILISFADSYASLTQHYLPEQQKILLFSTTTFRSRPVEIAEPTVPKSSLSWKTIKLNQYKSI
jgi:hypothetical protein